MPIFKIKSGKLNQLEGQRVELEKPLQNLIEKNLSEIFSLEFVASEFNLENFWLDTFTFNPDTGSFVIIEYKKTESWSLIDQGQTYLNLLLDHKADVLMAYNELKQQNKKLKDIAWDQSRIIFISPSFTPYQRRALTPDMPFELWQVKLFEEDLVSLTKIEPLVIQRAGGTKRTLSGPIAKEIKVYTIDGFLKKSSPVQRELIETLREKILGLDQEIVETVRKDTVFYKVKKSFVSLGNYKKDQLTVYFHEGKKLKDPDGLLKGRGKYAAYLYAKSQSDIPAAMQFVKAAYELASKLG